MSEGLEDAVPPVQVSASPEAPSPVTYPDGLLAKLACADACPDGAFAEINEHLRETLTLSERQAMAVKDGRVEPELAALTAPFIARSIMEATCTALLGRFDPFRLLILREKQLLDDYDYSERNSIALNWSTDFHSDQKSSGTIDLQTRPDTLPRSLFGKYYERVLWLEAKEIFANKKKTPRTDWLIELNRVAAGAFIPSLRSDVQKLYSRCSKAIHQEFVVKNADYSDTSFMNVQLGQALEYMAKLCAIFNFSPHVLRPVNGELCLETFQLLNEKWLA